MDSDPETTAKQKCKEILDTHRTALAVIIALSFEKSNSVLMMDRQSVSRHFNAASRRSRLVGAHVYATNPYRADRQLSTKAALWRFPPIWRHPAPQNRLLVSAAALVDNGCIAVIEGRERTEHAPEDQRYVFQWRAGTGQNISGASPPSQLEMSQNRQYAVFGHLNSELILSSKKPSWPVSMRDCPRHRDRGECTRRSCSALTWPRLFRVQMPIRAGLAQASGSDGAGFRCIIRRLTDRDRYAIAVVSIAISCLRGPP